MKKIVLVLWTCSILYACKKDSNAETSTTKNTVTYTTEGKTYTVNESKKITGLESTFVNSYIYKGSSYNSFNLDVEGSNLPFEMYTSIDGPLTGIGHFTDVIHGWVKEKYSGSQGYDIVEADVNVTTSSSSQIKGTYEFTLENTSGTKTLTGTFTINQHAQ